MTQESRIPNEAPRVALVTGASRGLGAALAQALALDGWQVVAVARTQGALEELDDRIRAAGGAGATLAPLDITAPEPFAHLCRAIHDRWGKVDLWAHCAIHATPLGPAGHLAEKEWTRSIDVNLRATTRMIPMVDPLLKAAPHGLALFLDDPRAGEAFFGAYGATKAAQIALARSWQAENARLGPRVLIETPPPLPTATRARFYPGEDRGRLTPCRDEAQRLLAVIKATAPTG